MTHHRARPVNRLDPVILKFLSERGLSRCAAVARALGVKQLSVSRALVRLKTEGIVTAVLSKEGRPVTFWCLTDSSFDLTAEDSVERIMPMRQTWKRVGEWKQASVVPRTSVFDTRHITEES